MNIGDVVQTLDGRFAGFLVKVSPDGLTGLCSVDFAGFVKTFTAPIVDLAPAPPAVDAQVRAYIVQTPPEPPSD